MVQNLSRSLLTVPLLLLGLLPAIVETAASPLPNTSLPEIKKDCSTCHRDIAKGPALRKPLSSLCLDCHPERKAPAEHRVDVVPSTPVRKLPLQEGRITCVTCHDPHTNSNGKLLRIPARILCTQCHPY